VLQGRPRRLALLGNLAPQIRSGGGRQTCEFPKRFSSLGAGALRHSGGVGPAESLAVFGRRETPIEWRMLTGAVFGAVLVHEIDVGLGAEYPGDPLDELVGPGDIAGQYEVADHETAEGDAVEQFDDIERFIAAAVVDQRNAKSTGNQMSTLLPLRLPRELESPSG
jgi:hypothetical protein